MGPTAFYAGTHTRSFHEARRAHAARTGVRALMSQLMGRDPIATLAPSAMVLSAGDMVVWDTKTHHHGTRNTSTARRMLLSFSFLAAGSEACHLPGYLQFLATRDVWTAQYRVKELIAGAHGPNRVPPPRRIKPAGLRRDEAPLTRGG